MAQDPEGVLTLHKECYVGIVPRSEVDALVRDLDEAELASDAIDAFCGRDSDLHAERLSPERVEDTQLESVVRRIFGFGQVKVEEAYLKALEAGEPVVRVCVPEEDHDTRAAVERAMLDHDAEYIHWFGQWSFEEVIEGTPRPGERA